MPRAAADRKNTGQSAPKAPLDAAWRVSTPTRFGSRSRLAERLRSAKPNAPVFANEVGATAATDPVPVADLATLARPGGPARRSITCRRSVPGAVDRRRGHGAHGGLPDQVPRCAPRRTTPVRRAAVPRPAPLVRHLARRRRRPAEHGAAGPGPRAVLDDAGPLHPADRQQRAHPPGPRRRGRSGRRRSVRRSGMSDAPEMLREHLGERRNPWSHPARRACDQGF